MLAGKCIRYPRTPINPFQRTNPEIGGVDMSEDCLHLNIWRPESVKSEDKLPVFVYIYGGSFLVGAGSNDVIKPVTFTSKNTILVSFNYRLGLFGFWRHRELTLAQPDRPTNFGLHDQISALEWINKNIAHFGGDPESVTVFGESAGGMSILNLLVSPRVIDKTKPKLFHRAAISNAVVLNHKFLEMDVAESIGDALAKDVGCKEEGKVFECMKNIDEEKLVIYSYSRWSAFDREMHKELLFPAFEKNFPSVLTSLSKGIFAKDIPIIIGTAKDEGTLFSWFTFPIYGPERDFLETIIGLSFPGYTEQIFKKYDAMKFANNWDLYSEIFGDVTWQCPNNLVADLLSQYSNQPIRKYVFGYQPKYSQQVFGVFHSIELGFIFQHASGTYLWPSNFTNEEEDFSSKVSNLWIDFGKGELKESDWPKYNSNNKIYLQFGLENNTDIITNHTYKKEICEFWRSTYPNGPQEFPDHLMDHEGLLSRKLNEFFWLMTRHMWIFKKENIYAFGGIILIVSVIILKKKFSSKNISVKLKQQ